MNFRNVEYEFLYYIYTACHKLQFSIVSQITLKKDVMKGDHELNSYENPNDRNRQKNK